MESKKKQTNKWTNKTKSIDTENRLAAAKEEAGEVIGEIGDRDQDVQTSSYEASKSQGDDEQHGGHSREHCTANVKVAKKVNLASSHQKKTFLELCVVTDSN